MRITMSKLVQMSFYINPATRFKLKLLAVSFDMNQSEILRKLIDNEWEEKHDEVQRRMDPERFKEEARKILERLIS
jgi:uncharacterized membrane protein YheB (UPF0754 family)